MKINFGCGNDRLDGYLNFDREVDLNKKLPFKDNSVDEIVLYHVLEHVNDKEFTLNECIRILKKDGVIKVKLPLYAPVVEHKTVIHPKHYFFRFYGYNDGKLILDDFKKGKHHFKGSVLGDIKNLFGFLLDLLRFNEYYWELRKR